MANNNDKRLVSFINEDCGFLYDINTSLESDKFDWHIHYVTDASDIVGIINAHTHGLEKYDQMDLQIVLEGGPKSVQHTLNILGQLVQSGTRFNDGDEFCVIPGIKIRFKKYRETGRDVLRAIIADNEGLFPDDEDCSAPWCYQQHDSINEM